MGVVFRARHEPTGKIVAVKLFPPALLDNESLVKRFEREMRVLRNLRHPNIVRCYGGSPRPPQPFFAMEYVKGGSLAELIKRKGHLTWEETIDFGVQICRALSCAHEHGIIHRDLKPSNLLLTERGVIKLSDFGLARGQDTTALTAPGKTVGTYAYMAPEQITGKPGLSPKTDLYALGCVLYEMLVGEPPFQAESPAEVLYKHIQEKPPEPIERALDCPVWLNAIVLQLLQKDPQKRPPDANFVEQQLLEARERTIEQTAATVRISRGGPDPLADTARSDNIPVEVRRELAGRPTKKTRKKKQHRPFYEHPAALVGALAALILFIVWMMLPPSEAELYARAREAMQSNSEATKYEAYERYLIPYRERFPEGEHIDEINAWIDEVEMIKAENRFLANVRLGRDPRSEYERKYREAWQIEQFGDPVTALQKYQALVELFKDDPDARPYVNLARKQIRRLQNTAKNVDRIALVRRKLELADELYAKGQRIEARRIWISIVDLYRQDPEMQELVDEALDRLAGGSTKRSKSQRSDEASDQETRGQGNDDARERQP